MCTKITHLKKVVCMTFALLLLVGCSAQGPSPEAGLVTDTPIVRADEVIPQATKASSPTLETPMPQQATNAVSMSASANAASMLVTQLTLQNQTISIRAPMPQSFPDTVYEITLNASGQYPIENKNDVFSAILGGKSIPPTTHYLKTEDAITFEPKDSQAMGRGDNGYPITGVISENEADKSVVVLSDNINWNDFSENWAEGNAPKSTIETAIQRAYMVLDAMGVSYKEPSILYRSLLKDGKEFTELFFPIYRYGLPMQSSAYKDENAWENNAGEWGFVKGETVHFQVLDDGTIYSIDSGRFFSESSRQVITNSLFGYEQALQQLFSRSKNYSLHSTTHQYEFEVLAIRPCYIKLAIEGTNDTFLAHPAWEICFQYNAKNLNTKQQYSGISTGYVDAVTGKIYE